MHLPDINVLIALVWNHHPYHNRAKRWFDRERTGQWLTCALTQLGFLRISGNPAISGADTSMEVAHDLLQQLVAHPNHRYLSENLPPVELSGWGKLHGYNKTTDIYLIALAEQHKATLVTFDQGLESSGRAVRVLKKD